MRNEFGTIAYFSMEIGLETAMQTYSGGLGILAGDTIRSAADLKLPMVGVSLLYRKGYFYQRLDDQGWQTEEPCNWSIDDFLEETSGRATVELEGREIQIRAWKYEVSGVGGNKIPVFFLDTDLPENTDWDRTLTHHLYGGDQRFRLCQEAILGIGGVRMLRDLGFNRLQRFHMNEGHASLLAVELLGERMRADQNPFPTVADIEEVRSQCVFTTHTPVLAGHDQFPLDLVQQVLGEKVPLAMKDVFCCEGVLNMTFLGFNLSHYVNGVAKSHGKVSQSMFSQYCIDAITNGVHAGSWASVPMQKLFDTYIEGWREDPFSLRYALSIPQEEMWQAHLQAKRELVQRINRESNAGFDENHFTLGFARRSTAYKRADLLFQDLDRLKRIAAEKGPIQIVYAGKAHPRDQEGKELIQRIWRIGEKLKEDIRLVYLVNYDMEIGRLATAGVDVWLNTPLPPLEASGTSGMKAAINGVPSLSILDGWWIEGCIEGVTGWAIGKQTGGPADGSLRDRDAAALYDKLEFEILPMFYNERDRFLTVMLHAISLNGSFFNTHRMMQQYVLKAYFS